MCIRDRDYDSSSFDEEEVETESDDDVIVGAQAYMFEPEFAEGEVEDLVDEDGDDNDRLLNTEWCTCTNCVPMPTAKECICCNEVTKINEKMEKVDMKGECITHHPGFRDICLNEWVLQVAYLAYRQ
ncbi:uncharacterized protein LOC117109201 [Anneissia japonica]|uniref:uncharacterized protein LOC117109201 n=1 Tax=Anneissia japonica TaxID=1529436 RepID=UPI0014258FDC|nr:uncharacterized protein LOC117109201 [Anneissia japonica]